jgi:hypothetical protein
MMALNEENDEVERIMRSSYGILCRELYDETLPGHIAVPGQDLVIEDLDGKCYVEDSLVWLITKVRSGSKLLSICLHSSR